MKLCVSCGKEIQDAARICRFCRAEQPVNGAYLLENVRSRGKLKCSGGIGKSMGIFVAADIAVLLVLLLAADAVDPESSEIVFCFALLFGCTVPFIMLFFSKTIAKRQFDIKTVNPDAPGNDQERFLLELISALAGRAGLPVVPEIGIYRSEEANAFATGRGKSDALIAFSSGLLERMPEEYAAAVAAHETAHIANGDMLTMTLLDGLINSAVVVADFAIEETGWYEKTEKESCLLVGIIHFVIVNVLMLAGNLVLLWFSRHREFEADETAACLVSPEAMIGALHALDEDDKAGSRTDADAPAAAMMISASPAWTDLFSTHPSLERRIRQIEFKFKK